MSGHKKLAIDGGTPAITDPLPQGAHGASLMGDEEIAAAAEVMRSQKLFRYGGTGQCEALEKEAGEWLGVKHAVFLTTGTAGLTCALAALQIGPGDEVIVPGYTYIATAAAVLTVGAVPVIAEIDESLGLDPQDCAGKITPHTRAVIAVHMQGVPCRLDAIRNVARERGLHVIEDCCQAVGSSYRGAKTGVGSSAGSWSLNFFKAITCGEGGLFFTSDADAFERALFQHDPALPMWLKDRPTWHTPPFSRDCYRGNEITAAIARVQLRKLPAILAHCRGLKQRLLGRLAPSPRCYVRQHVDDPAGECGFSFAMIARTTDLAQRLTAALRAEGLEIGSAYNEGFPDRHIYAYWDSIIGKNAPTPAGYPWKDPAYKGRVEYARDMCPRTLDILRRALRVSIHMNLRERHIDQIADAVNKVDAGLAV
jgi:dTDP-4-amino-4,6-dideoxygalactose transaminase